MRLSGVEVGVLNMAAPGRHNASNALAAIAAARDAGIEPRLAVAAMESFAGVKRRLEVKGEAAGIEVIDDFAHHPTAIFETIAALRSKVGDKRRIIAVFEPRSNTMKLGTMKARLPEALAGADRVYCYRGPGVDWDPATALLPLGLKAHTLAGAIDDLAQTVASDAREGDVILCMSNGSFGGIHQKILDRLRARSQSASH